MKTTGILCIRQFDGSPRELLMYSTTVIILVIYVQYTLLRVPLLQLPFITFYECIYPKTITMLVILAKAISPLNSGVNATPIVLAKGHLHSSLEAVRKKRMSDVFPVALFRSCPIYDR
jgi:hypothetical protein